MCGDWEKYKEEKCIKLFKNVSTQSFDDAKKICAENEGSKLVTIHYHEKQTFLEEYLFTKNHAVDNVWLGAKTWINNSSMFHWEDGTNLTVRGGQTETSTGWAQFFTNWALGNPKVLQSNSCIQMHAEQELRGKWSDEPCAKKNLVLCEKKQKWSLEKMQEKIETMMHNPVPLGFIYVQLPNQYSPQEIWPWMIWTDDSKLYDSTFFRVAGSKAEAFGKVQEDFSPYIDEIWSPCVDNCNYTTKVKFSRAGGWSGDIYTAIEYQGGNKNETLNFHMAGGEVRPRNMAVKVWRRVA